MKANSCVLRATERLVSYQFGLSVDADKFRTYNDGRGIPVGKLPLVIESILPGGIQIDRIYVCGEIEFEGGYHYVNVKSAKENFVPAPNLSLVEDDHIVACLPGEYVACSVAITLKTNV